MPGRRTRAASSRLWWRALGALAVGLTIVLPLGGLYFSERFLCVEAQPVNAQVLVVLGGETVFRRDRAWELYEEHIAPRVIVSGGGDCDDVRAFLVAKGVPPDAIETEPASRSTKENAEFSVRILRQHHVQRAVVVTSWFHSRRALNCFRRYAPEIEFVAAPTLADRPKRGWPNNYERGRVLFEYIKLAGYWVRYGISPF